MVWTISTEIEIDGTWLKMWKCDFLFSWFHSYETVVCVWQWLIDCLQFCERANDKVQSISKGVGGGAKILAEAILLQEAVEYHCDSVSSLIEVSKQDQL